MDLYRSTGNSQRRQRSPGAMGRCGITRGGFELPAAAIRRIHYQGGPVSERDPPALRLTSGLKASSGNIFRPGCSPECRHPSGVNHPSRPRKPNSGDAELSANGPAPLTIRSQTRILPGEPNISDFEILSGLPVNHGATFAGKRAFSSGSGFLSECRQANGPAQTGSPKPLRGGLSQCLRRWVRVWLTAQLYPEPRRAWCDSG